MTTLLTLILSVLSALTLVYLFLLNRRLLNPHPLLRPDAPPAEPEWDDLGDYSSIDMLDHIPREPTQRGYVVTGGCGTLGGWIVRLLLLRGERHVRILDLAPPPADLVDRDEVDAVKGSITSRSDVEAALNRPFADGTRPSVVFHTASVIRYWERLPHLYHLSHKPNVVGTQLLLSVAAATPSIQAFIYTSTAALSNKKGHFMRLGYDLSSEEDFTAREDIPGSQDHHYISTKRIADKLVREADGKGDVRTAVIRPGMSIWGLGDVTAWAYLSISHSTTTPYPLPVFHHKVCQHAVCSQDLAAAHILLSEALTSSDPKTRSSVAGEAFMVTGDRKFYEFSFICQLLQRYARRRLVFSYPPAVLIFLVSHLIESFLLVRWYFLLPFWAVFAPGSKPVPVPKWMGLAGALQPACLETALSAVWVDDSKFRKTVGYRNAWSTLQSLRWVVDEFEKLHYGAKDVKPTPPANKDDGDLAATANGHSNGVVEVRGGATAAAGMAKQTVLSTAVDPRLFALPD